MDLGTWTLVWVIDKIGEQEQRLEKDCDSNFQGLFWKYVETRTNLEVMSTTIRPHTSVCYGPVPPAVSAAPGSIAAARAGSEGTNLRGHFIGAKDGVV